MEDLVKNEKKTILMATHNLTEAMSMCTRIGLLSHGNVLAVGTPEEISRSVGDHVEVTIDLQGDGSRLEVLQQGLAKVEGVISVALEDNNGDTRVRLIGKRDLNYLDMFSLLQRERFKVLSLESSAPSLEDAFLKLTKEARK
jgi:ABC-2 type transport system ATP-binding protein